MSASFAAGFALAIALVLARRLVVGTPPRRSVEATRRAMPDRLSSPRDREECSIQHGRYRGAEFPGRSYYQT